MATAPTVAPTLKRPLHLPLIKFRYFLYMFIVGSVQGLFIFEFFLRGGLVTHNLFSLPDVSVL